MQNVFQQMHTWSTSSCNCSNNVASLGFQPKQKKCMRVIANGPYPAGDSDDSHLIMQHTIGRLFIRSLTHWHYFLSPTTTTSQYNTIHSRFDNITLTLLLLSFIIINSIIHSPARLLIQSVGHTCMLHWCSSGGGATCTCTWRPVSDTKLICYSL